MRKKEILFIFLMQFTWINFAYPKVIEVIDGVIYSPPTPDNRTKLLIIDSGFGSSKHTSTELANPICKQKGGVLIKGSPKGGVLRLKSGDKFSGFIFKDKTVGESQEFILQKDAVIKAFQSIQCEINLANQTNLEKCSLSEANPSDQAKLTKLCSATQEIGEAIEHSTSAKESQKLTNEEFDKLINQNLDQILEKYGAETLERLKAGEYDSFDPMCNDGNCQTRAPWLVQFALKLRRDSHYEPSREEKIILGAYAALKFSTIQKEDPIGILIEQRTGTEFPTSWKKMEIWTKLTQGSNENLSNTKAALIYGKIKAKVTEFTLNFLRKELEDEVKSTQTLTPGGKSKTAFLESLIERYNHKTFIEYGDVPIRSIENFPGMTSVLEVAKFRQLPLTVIVKQVIHEEGKHKLNGTAALYFEPTEPDGHFKFISLEKNSPKRNIPTIAIELYNMVPKQEKNIDLNGKKPLYPFMYSTNFSELIEGLKKENVENIIQITNGGDDEFRPKAYLLQEQGEGKNAKQIPLHPVSNSFPKAKGDFGTLEREIRGKSKQENFGVLYWSGAKNHEHGSRFTGSIPFTNHHVKVMTYDQADQHTQKIESTYQGKELPSP